MYLREDETRSPAAQDSRLASLRSAATAFNGMTSAPTATAASRRTSPRRRLRDSAPGAEPNQAGAPPVEDWRGTVRVGTRCAKHTAVQPAPRIEMRP